MAIKLLEGRLFLHLDNFDSMVSEMMGAYGGDMEDVICVLKAHGIKCDKTIGHNTFWTLTPINLSKIDEAMLDFFVHIARGGVTGSIIVLYDDGLKERYRFEHRGLWMSQEETCWGRETPLQLQEELTSASL